MSHNVNVLLTSFPGLSLPRTVCLSLPSTSTADDLLSVITTLIPRGVPATSDLLLTTTSNQIITRSYTTTLTDLATQTTIPCLLPLRLSVRLLGGKGGFGSQLRAAGGRMSSRKKRTTTDPNGSNRNLDGRRLRTITEAKNLAAYLATKPEMDRKEKEERRKRWEQVVDLAERKEDEMRRGIGSDGRRRGLTEEWVESKEEVGENVRNAVALAMKAAATQKGPDAEEMLAGSSGSTSGGSRVASHEGSDEEEEDEMELDDNDIARLHAEAEEGDADAIWVLKNKVKVEPPPSVKKQDRKFVGFEEDDDFLSSDDDPIIDAKGKGKASAIV